MKTFSFIIPVIAGILCLLYLLLYPCPSTPPYHDFTARVLAKENSRHNNISHALLLKINKKYQEKLAAYETCYYYISNLQNLTFSITSDSVSQLKADFLSDSGNLISFHTQKRKNICTLTPDLAKGKNSERIFFRITNQSASSCYLQLQVTTLEKNTKKKSLTPEKTAAPKTDNHTTSNSKKTVTPIPDNYTTSNSKKIVTPIPDNYTNPNSKKTATPKPEQEKLSTIFLEKAKLHPQFLLLSPTSVHKLTIIQNSQKNSAKDFIWLSTNPRVATVNEGTVTAHSEGTAVIYLQNKKYSKITSSCLIRVIDKEKISVLP